MIEVAKKPALVNILGNIQQKLLIATLIIGLLLPVLGIHHLYIHLLVLVCINTFFALSITILFGFTGEISLGQSGFFAIGAYTSALLMQNLGLPLFISMLIAVLISGIIGLLLSYPARRVKGFYLAILTFGFGYIIQEAIKHMKLTGGFMGLIGIPSVTLKNLNLFNFPLDIIGYYYIALTLLLVTFLLLNNLLKSNIGRSMVSIASSEIAATSLGINSGKVRQLSYGISGALAGLGGVLYAHLIGYLGYESFGIITAAMILTYAILGGLKALIGALFGAFILTIVPHYLHVFQEWEFFFLGFLLVGIIVFLPEGVASLFNIRTTLIRQGLLENSYDPGGKVSGGLNKEEVQSQEKENLLTVNKVSKHFGGVQALSKLSFEVEQGSIHGLIGPNGSGKSTLINIITSFYKPDEGTVLFQQEDITHASTYNISRKGIVRSFQDPQPYKGMTVLENVISGAYHRYNRGFGDFVGMAISSPATRKKERSVLQESLFLLEQVGLLEKQNDLIENLSFGDMRLIEIVRAINAHPKLLILDEPAAGLSSIELKRLGEVIGMLKSQGMTIIIIEHHIGFLVEIADCLTVLDYGKKIFSGCPKECIGHPDVINAYLGEVGDA